MDARSFSELLQPFFLYLPPELLSKMAESDFMAYGSIEMIFACLAAFWVALQVLHPDRQRLSAASIEMTSHTPSAVRR